MAVPRQSEAQEYIEKQRIMELFDNITAQLVFHRPDNPKTFMIDYVEKLKESRTTQLDFPCLFDESNIESVFGMLDPTKKGFITSEQYKESTQTLGCDNVDPSPAGSDMDMITQDTFRREVKTGLKKASATFEQV
ncbi:EF-hand calcium-binding domain-containing protein 10-like [Asterias rubens]|uniref:EF-hand calcium-binding domain-containing protein 10-like n=1 Tax=Asterias rubens TaxID=7604 RepID=UPI001454ED32|nr:EF-hand calcium-binding domain-containing protein 10-like [Asterias rubens]